MAAGEHRQAVQNTDDKLTVGVVVLKLAYA
jgi:hypothetical protein